MGLAFKTNVSESIENGTNPEQSLGSAGTQRKEWPWRVRETLTFCSWLGEVMVHTGKAEWDPNEVGLESKEGKLKT